MNGGKNGIAWDTFIQKWPTIDTGHWSTNYPTVGTLFLCFFFFIVEWRNLVRIYVSGEYFYRCNLFFLSVISNRIWTFQFFNIVDVMTVKRQKYMVNRELPCCLNKLVFQSTIHLQVTFLNISLYTKKRMHFWMLISVYSLNNIQRIRVFTLWRWKANKILEW